ncbi:MAG: AAA family ATPase, partial [Hyphomicrobiaceae bacterium]
MARAAVPQDVEDIPEIDRLGEFPHPRETEHVFGHTGAEAEVAEALHADRMHHALLVTGPLGIGKATFAYRLAAHALAGRDERDPARASLRVAAETTASRQVRAMSHPGLLVL